MRRRFSVCAFLLRQTLNSPDSRAADAVHETRSCFDDRRRLIPVRGMPTVGKLEDVDVRHLSFDSCQLLPGAVFVVIALDSEQRTSYA